MKINNISYTTIHEEKISIDFKSSTEKNSDNVYSIVIGNNGSGKTAIIEAILRLFSTRYQKNYGNFISKSSLITNDGKKLYFDSQIGDDTSKENYINKVESLPIKRIVVSTYSPYDRILINKSKRQSKGLDTDYIDVFYPENDSVNVQSLVSSSYLKNILSGNNRAVEELGEIIGFKSEGILMHLSRLPSMSGRQLRVILEDLDQYDTNKLNQLANERLDILGVNRKEYIDIFKITTEEAGKTNMKMALQDIVNKNRRPIKDRDQLIILLAILSEIKDLLIKYKRINSKESAGLPKTQLLDFEELIKSYTTWYKKDFDSDLNSKQVINLLRIDIEILEIMKIFMVNNLVLNRRNDSVTIDNLSSGEFSLFARIMELYSSVEENSLVLIDEPETHLNPKWIYEYMYLLHKLFEGKKSHFIIMSQSPFIVGSAKKEDIVLMKKVFGSQGEVTKIENIHNETLGALYNRILCDAFDIDYSDNKISSNYIRNIKSIAKTDFLRAIELSTDLAETPQKTKLMNELFSDENFFNVEEQIKKMEGNLDV